MAGGTTAVDASAGGATYNLPTFFFSIIVLAYLSTFVFFAAVRILTGISIQRLGNLSLRGIYFEPRDDIKLEIRRIGLTFHRPTFTQPTWISIVVQDSKATLDLRQKPDAGDAVDVESKPDEIGTSKVHSRSNSKRKSQIWERSKNPGPESDKEKGKLVELVRKSKESMKKVHQWIKWIKLVDVMLINTTVTIKDVGSIQVGSLTMLADTRRKGGDRNQMFDHCAPLQDGQFPVEWCIVTKNILFFSPNSKIPTELLDYGTTTIYGVMEEEFKGIRDLAMAIKVGRIDVPCDSLMDARDKLKALGKEKLQQQTSRQKGAGISLSTVMEEMATPGSRTERMAEAVMESKEVLNSILRGIKEVQFAVGYLVISKAVSHVQPTGKPLRIIMSMKEFGIDVHRLDQKSPAHRMYFSAKDIAHQALLAAISISVNIDDGIRQDKIVYIPMVTMTNRTTLLSKTIEIVEQLESNRNTNILFANMVVTSPSIDLEPRHLPILVALLKSGPKRPANPSEKRAHLMSRLLPKANIKFSIQEPVIRILLPPTEPEFKGTDDMDMLISSLSSISVDLESSHESEGQAHYALSSAFRLTNHVLYYQAASGIHHDLLHSETFDLKLQLTATPEVQVVANAYLNTFSLRLAQPEIVQGLKQMVTQFKGNYKPDKLGYPEVKDSRSFLRQIPLWLDQIKMECSDFTIEVAGIDEEVSDATRGVAWQMDEWTINYVGKKSEYEQRPTPRRRISRNVSSEDIKPRDPSHQTSKNPTDGRCLMLNFRGVDAFIVDSAETWEQDPFISLPQVDFSLSTGSDLESPTLHFNSAVNSFFLHYSLYRHYCIIVAGKILKEAFGGFSIPEATSMPTSPQKLDRGHWGDMEAVDSPANAAPEFLNVDVKFTHVKIKANFPDDPPLMMEMHGIAAGRHRWGFPFFKSKHFRLYVESPKMKNCWARMISMRQFRLDMRETRRRNDGSFVEEHSIDSTADAIRVAIPHQVELYRITDNIVNAVKASEQMHHRFKTGTNEYILDKGPEGPKLVPRITLRTRALLLELEDDPFETKLGLIYRIGLTEQKKRLARLAAFDAKVKKMEESQPPSRRSCETTRTNLNPTDQSTKPRGLGRTRTWRSERPPTSRTDNPETKSRWRHMRHRSGAGGMRYDPDTAQEPSNSASIGVEEAWERLLEHESAAWIKRIRIAMEEHRALATHNRETFWGEDEMPQDEKDTEDILGLPQRPALMAAYLNDAQIIVNKPSFPLEELPKFLHRVGKGLPEDTEFALLIPLNVKINFGEGRVLLRDYPLPFIHIPQMRVGQSARLHALSLQSDFVIAEEFRGPECMRQAKVCVVPPSAENQGFAINVRRTVSAVKSYSDIKVAINTSYATRITWCMSYQPAIQDMMMALETLTKPHVDPSERTGFWDKIRLVFHSMISLSWEGDGDVHLMLKGSRDPYKITGEGAGIAMCWRGNVRWDLGRDPSPEKGVQVESEEFLLAVPDFTRHATEDLDAGTLHDSKSFLSTNNINNGALFKKVIMKLSGRITWLVGLMFEQELTNEEDWKLRKRSFEFIPHYEVTLRSPEHATAPPGEVYDAFKGFRSHHLHLSLAIISPIDREWTSSSNGDQLSTSYNTIHLSPRFFTHIFAWWNLFSGALSLPIRQGDLWPGVEKSSKKFGHHLATIKYKLCLAPLFISHVYKHSDRDDAGQEIVAATGLKGRLDSFTLDIHQRREETLHNPKSTTMTMNQAELDFHNADIRAVSAFIDKLSLEDLISQASASPDDVSEEIQLGDSVEVDGDYRWIDMDDFVELDWALPKNRPPKVKIIPLAFAPRFTYFRQTDHSGDDGNCSVSSFGHESTHSCIISQDNDPREIQCALVQARLERVNQQMSRNKDALERLAQRTRMNPDQDATKESEVLMEQSSILYDKREFLQNMLRQISSKLDDKGGTTRPGSSSSGESGQDTDRLFGPDSAPLDYSSDFDNRFIIHNMQAKWNNSIRNVILKYIHQVGQRRGFVYYMSRRAVKFILDIIEEQKQSGKDTASGHAEWVASPTGSPQAEDPIIEKRIQQLLDDEIKVVIADEGSPSPPSTGHADSPSGLAADDLAGDLTDDYVPENSYHVRLIAPQIQMQSEKNEGAAVLVAAQGMQLKVVSVMDRERLGDDVSGLVQRRFALNLENTQFFVSHHQDFVHQSMSLHSANRYGAPQGSSWPPWVPLESMFDFRNSPVGFSRVVERTSATLRYEKHNSLRLKYGDRVSELQSGPSATKSGPLDTERPVDTISVDFPRVEASCDSSQYFAMYIIVLDLLLYTEPLEKLRNEKLEKIILASDFSDLTGAPEMVERLQGRIHQLEEIKEFFEINAKTLDLEGWKSRESVDHDLANCEDELFFLMKAITRAQRKYNDQSSRSNSIIKLYLTASEIVWHLMCEQVNNKRDSLMDISLTQALYKRSNNADGSNSNEVEVRHIKGYNLLPDAVYPEMITAYFRDEQSYIDFASGNMLRVSWNMLESIGGIPIMDRFEVHLHPLRVQLERDVGERIFEYIFPGVGQNSGEGNSFSPFLVHSMRPIVDSTEETSVPNEYPVVHAPMDDTASEHSRHSSDLELRLRPTLSLTGNERPGTAISEMRPGTAISDMRPKTSHTTSSFFGSSAWSIRERYTDNSSMRTVTGETVTLSTTTRKSLDGGRPPLTARSKSAMLFGRTTGHVEKQPSDELSQMMSRASNYMTLSYIKIHGVTLCLSYKGRGESNLEDIHEFVFRMPTLEYRNKTWSNYDLAMHLKKDVIRALISHTGAILQNKLTNHRPSRPANPSQPGKKKNILPNFSTRDQSNNSLTAPSSELGNASNSSSSSSIFNFRTSSSTPTPSNGRRSPMNDESANKSESKLARRGSSASRQMDQPLASHSLGLAGLNLMGDPGFGYSATISSNNSNANDSSRSVGTSGVERLQNVVGRHFANFGARGSKDNSLNDDARPHTANPAGNAKAFGGQHESEGNEADKEEESGTESGGKKKLAAAAGLRKKVFGGL